MRIFVFCIALAVGLFSCKIEDRVRQTERTEYYPNGKIKSKGSYLNSIRDGRSIAYYPNGGIKSVSDWTNNKLNGPISYYDSLGKLMAIETYKNGLRNGIAIDFFPSNGFIRTKTYYKNGIQHGSKFQYFENDSGKVFAEIHYLNFQGKEKENGSVWYDRAGNVVREFRRVVLKSKEDTINAGKDFELEIELKRPRFDSTTFILGDYKDMFLGVDSTSFDTLKAPNHKNIIVKRSRIKGDNYIRGFANNMRLIKKTNDETISQEVLPIYFEYHYYVK